MINIMQTLLDYPEFKSQVKYKKKMVPANTKILERDKMHSSVYIIEKGKVRVSLSSEPHEKLAIHPSMIDIGPNEIVGEFTMFDDLPSSEDVITVTDTELVEIDIASFKLFLENSPKIGFEVLKYIAAILVKRLRHTEKTALHLYVWGIKVHHIDKYL